MLKKLNNKVLLIVFVILLVVVVSMKISENKDGARNFRSNLVKIDTSKVNKLELISKAKDTIVLTKENTIWNVKSNNQKNIADQSAVYDILNSLTSTEIKRCVAINSKTWKKYQVTDSLGTRLKVYNNSNLLADIMVGKFSYKRFGRSFKISTNARLYNEKKVYTIDDNLSMSAKKNYNALRNHTLLSVNKNNITKVSITNTDDKFTLTKNGTHWMIDGQAADSAKTQKVFEKWHNITARNFSKTASINNKIIYSMVINLSNGKTIKIDAYQNNDKYLIKSSQNQGSIFNESKFVFDKILVTKKDFIK